MTSLDLLDGRLKFRHLTLATAIADHGSVVRAAEALHLTQPAATRSLRELEELVGARLFERGPRGMTATVYGTALVDHARLILAEVRRAGEHLAGLREGQTGTVTVGTLLAGTSVLLPRAVAALKRERPQVTVVVREATYDVLYQQLLAGEVDLVVGRLSPPPEPGRVRQHTLYHEPIRLMARREHPLHAARGELALADTLAHPWILPLEQTTLRGELEGVFDRHGLPLPTDRVECTSILTVRALLTATDMIAALPELVVTGDDRLAALPVALESVRRTVGTTLLADRPATPAVREFLRHLETEGDALRAALKG
ncbi:LysR substrate-binding domain-containing protein [Yinghuangia seranimata]|uniref:LysR substrate-binding domain-containing protein n=1 Tax=Yinghuangia seranimata TaxID=408067 RepID=UPI00248BEDB7|nr:LysR substrate-binding domain-containing protein [Yinghuangia seranimata]MDI2132318.1 LysR substrate-binding domain-containing protein [Yinghuangia seranimata]